MEMAQKVRKILSGLNIDFIYLFGSSVSAKTNSESDFDLAFESSQEYDNYQIFLLAQDLSIKLGKEVDLVQLKKASTVFQKEILSNCRVLYEKDKTQREQYEMNLLKKYSRLNEERKEILDNYERRYHNQ